jgi:hypothetical protein
MQKMHENEQLGKYVYIQIYRQQNQLITEQQVSELNPLYEHAQLPHILQNSP